LKTAKHDRLTTRIVQLSFATAVCLAVAMPSLTWSESTALDVVGYNLNVRVVLYAGAACITTIGAAVTLLSAWVPLERRRSSYVPLVFLGWQLLAAVVAGQEIREWAPSLIRWLLYLSSFALAAAVAWRSLPPGPTTAERWENVLVAGLAATTVVPLAAGVLEFATGSAQWLNGVPRLAGTMPGHPVAYSLVFLTPSVFILVTALRAELSPWARASLALWLAAMYAVTALTFTRLTLVLYLLSGCLLIVWFWPVRPRTKVLSLLGIGTITLLLAVPIFAARSSLTSRVVVGPPWAPPTPAPSIAPARTGSPAQPARPDTWVLSIDNSTLLRLRTHALGVAYVLASPVFGHGPGSFDRLFARDTGTPNVAAHDDLLLVAVEGGLPALALYVATLGIILWHVRPSLWLTPSQRRLGIATVTSLPLLTLGAAIHNPLYFPELMLPLMISAGLVVGTLRAAARR
jgi:O-antigen ligase